MARQHPPSPAHRQLSSGLVVVMAAASAFLTANMYYAQPLVGPIGSSFGLSPAGAGLVVTLTQLGYGLGLLLIVPVADILENRRLILRLIAFCVASLFAAAAARHTGVFLAASLCIGMSSVAVQILFPYASHLTSDANRGRIIGVMTSGQMLGIMLARPAASLVAHAASWHLIFTLSGICLLACGIVVRRVLPPRMPQTVIGYRLLLVSMAHLARTTAVLQRRAFYHAALFASFCLFWTVVPLVLSGPGYGLSQVDIAWFSLVGAAGIVAAPIAGNVADRGWTRPATGVAIALAGIGFPLTWAARTGTAQSICFFAVAGVSLGVGITLNVVLGQRAIFALGETHRGKLNGLFMAAFYLSGAMGSAIGSWAYAKGGWPLACAAGFAMPVIAALGFSTEFLMRNRDAVRAIRSQ